jgi:tRNA(Leu) C34 or U34 (ribose-2'-O)-methylase TrmL
MNSPGVILISPKYAHNVAAAIRACSCFGVHSLVWTGGRVDPTQYDRLPREERMKGYRDVTWTKSERPFELFGENAEPVCVEIGGYAALPDFQHPRNAVYVFGPEDGGVPQVARRLCHRFIYIPSHHCLNLAGALNVVLYDRIVKLHERDWIHPAKTEQRGEIPVPGWEGQ